MNQNFLHSRVRLDTIELSDFRTFGIEFEFEFEFESKLFEDGGGVVALHRCPPESGDAFVVVGERWDGIIEIECALLIVLRWEFVEGNLISFQSKLSRDALLLIEWSFILSSSSSSLPLEYPSFSASSMSSATSGVTSRRFSFKVEIPFSFSANCFFSVVALSRWNEFLLISYSSFLLVSKYQQSFTTIAVPFSFNPFRIAVSTIFWLASAQEQLIWTILKIFLSDNVSQIPLLANKMYWSRGLNNSDFTSGSAVTRLVIYSLCYSPSTVY